MSPLLLLLSSLLPPQLAADGPAASLHPSVATRPLPPVARQAIDQALPRTGLGVDPTQDPALAAARALADGHQFRLAQVDHPTRIAPQRFRLQPLVGGVPVLDETLRLSQLRDGQWWLSGDLSPAMVAPWPGSEPMVAYDEAAAVAQALAYFEAELQPTLHAISLACLPGSTPRLVWEAKVDLGAASSLAYRLLIDADLGTVVAVEDLVVHQNGQAVVFMPNPVESLDNPNLSDQNDSAAAVPRAAYVPVSLLDLDGSGRMDGLWATTDATPNRSFAANLDFRANRSAKAFEEGMGYYHVDSFQRRLQALGIVARQTAQRINVEDKLFGIFEYANASYNPLSKVIAFGTLGVDFAEDADVIIHEYGHAIHDEIQGGIGGGFGGAGQENASMSEGYGDWFSAIHADDTLTGEWVGVSLGLGGSFPAVRRLDGLKRYPVDLVGEVHDDGELWSAALWEISHFLGNDEALVLVTEAMSLMSSNTGMPQAANLLFVADQQLTGGARQAYLQGPLLRSRLVSPPSGTLRLDANRRSLLAGDLLSFQLTEPNSPGADFQLVVSTLAQATPTGPPYNTTLDIGTELLGLSQAQAAFHGQLDASGQATLSLTVPPGLPWKQAYFFQAMLLDASGAATKLSPPIALRAERH